MQPASIAMGGPEGYMPRVEHSNASKETDDGRGCRLVVVVLCSFPTIRSEGKHPSPSDLPLRHVSFCRSPFRPKACCTRLLLVRFGLLERISFSAPVGGGHFLRRTTVLKMFEGALCFLEVRGASLEFRAIDFGAFIQAGILDRGRRRNRE